MNMLKLLLHVMFFIGIRGNQNLWLKPQIFEFGKSMHLDCNDTEKNLKNVSWWILREDRSPKRISEDLVLHFTSANHSHSATYECFHTFENRFLKYSRKVLVIESHCSRIILNDEIKVNNFESIISCQFKHVNFLKVDDCDRMECDGVAINLSKTTTSSGDNLNIVNVNYTPSIGNEKCFYGCENSKIPIFSSNPYELQLTITESIIFVTRKSETETTGSPVTTTSFLFIIIISTMGIVILLMAIIFVICYSKLKKSKAVASKEGVIKREDTSYEKIHYNEENQAYSLPMTIAFEGIYDEIKEPSSR